MTAVSGGRAWVALLWSTTRRGPGVTAFALTLAICAGHVLLRATWWRYEWYWAWYQFHFVTVLLGPAVAGVAYQWGASWHGVREVAASTNRTLGLVATATLNVAGPVVAGYLVGLVAVSAAVWGTISTPIDVVTTTTVGPPLALLLACIALGTAGGFVVGNRALAPLCALGVFALLLFGYVTAPDRYTKVGGATASLLGLETRPSVAIGQTVQFLALAVLLVALGTRPRPQTAARSLVLGSGLVLGGAVVGLTAIGGHEFRSRPVEVSCIGRSPAICLAEGYRAAEPRLRPILARYDRSLATAGLPRFEVYDQTFPPGPGRILLDPVFLLRYGPGGPADGFLLNELVPDGCRDDWDQQVSAAFDLVGTYLQQAWEADGRPSLSAVDRAAVVDAHRTLQGCVR